MQKRVAALLASAWALAGLTGVAAEVVSPHPEWSNLALGKAVQFSPPPNYPAVTDAEDARQAVDGRFSPATPMWYDKAALGWVMIDPVVFTVDLGSDQPIRGVALHIPGGQAGVEWPSDVQVYVSPTGERFSLVGDLMELTTQRPPGTGYATLWLLADRLETHARFVRFVCSPTNLGNGAYIFLDEIEVYAGDPAWLARPLTRVPAPTQWRAAWPEIRWREHPDNVPPAERPARLRLVDGTPAPAPESPLQQAVLDGDAVCFALTGEAGKVRSMTWTGRLPKPVSAENCRYALLRFRAEGIRRTYEPRPLVALQGVSAQGSENEVVLLEANLALNDGRTHTLVRPLPEGYLLRQIRVGVHTESDAPRLVLERLELLDAVPAVFGTEIVVTASPAMPRGLAPVELGVALNGSLTEWFDRALAAHKLVLDGARVLAPGPVTVSGVPFVIAPEAQDLATMLDLPETGELVEFLGEKVAKRYLGPVSRDDSLSIVVSAKAREVFLLIAASLPPVQTRGGLPNCPTRLDDIESLSVELTYDRGDSEVAFPYSLADAGCYVPARELGAYAVAADPTRRLACVTLHNHHFGPSFALAALTLNSSRRALVPQLADLAAPEPTASSPPPPARPVSVSHRGDRLTIGNRWYEYAFDLSQGFALDRVFSRANPRARVSLAPSSGLRLRLGDTVYTGRSFVADMLRVGAADVALKLTSSHAELPLEIAVTVTAVGDTPELAFAVQATNRGDKPLAAELCLPFLAGLTIGELGDTRLFFPQYRAVDTAEPVVLRAPYGPEFVLQFMDVYNRAAGIGLMFRTDNPEQRMVTFALRKDSGGVSGGVCFPAEYNELAPDAGRAYPTVSLFAHAGDWHAAFTLYRDWVRTWYRPDKAQDKDCFLNAWDLKCYRTSTKVSWADSRTPAVISPDRKRFLIDEAFAFDQKYLGHLPDLVHFFNWTYNDQKQRNENGVYATPLAYAQVGGLDFFRHCVDTVQTKWQRPLSLYTLSDRFRASALPDPELSRELTAIAVYQEPDSDASTALRGSGAADGIIFPAFGHDKWVEFFVSDITRLQRDTGCRIIYMDVFPYFSHLRGHNGLSPREGDLKVLKRMREALPADVALWTEYGFTDVASQYADGAVHYYFLDLNEVFARRYNRSDRADSPFFELPLNLGRYAFPRYRTFDLPCYIEAGSKPSQIDAVFVNGEPFHEDTWRLFHSRLREKLNRAYVLKHEYADCFATANPVPQVDTLIGGVTANLFPGTNRRLWTLYSGRPRTWSGAVLAIPHRDGARYRDAWNGRDLTPTVSKGLANIALTLHPQQPGCVVQEWSR